MHLTSLLRLPPATRVATALCLAVACAVAPARAADTPDYSPAEKLLFMSDQLGSLKLPSTLRYGFRRSGTMEDAFTDRVAVDVSALPGGQCCKGRGEFLSGTRQLQMPELEGGTGNPVVMYFLEREVREMQRLTKGSQSHFRKRIRMAIYESAAVRELTLDYRGKPVAGREIVISPYLDDPNRPKYEKLARKHYHFLLSDAVPGGIYGIRTQVDGETEGAAPLLLEEMYVEGAQAPRAAS